MNDRQRACVDWLHKKKISGFEPTGVSETVSNLDDNASENSVAISRPHQIML
jgi:hypothetical protein